MSKPQKTNLFVKNQSSIKK